MELKSLFAQDTAGNALATPTVYVYLPGTTTLASGLKNRAGAALTNPFTGTAQGLIEFRAANGMYDVRFVKDTRDVTLRELSLFDPNDSIANSTPAQLLAYLGIINNHDPLFVLNTTTLTLADLRRSIVFGGPGAATNYQVALPADAPAGTLAKIRIDGAAPGLYVLESTSGGIDGLPTRTMWRDESVLLERVSEGWKKIGGVSRPFRGYARRTTNQALTADAINRVAFDSAGGDSTGLNLWWDAARGRVIPPRRGYYHIGFNAVLAFNGSLTHVEFGIQQVTNDVTAASFNVTPPGAFYDAPGPLLSSARPSCSISGHYSANALGGWHGVIRPNGAAANIESVPGILETNLMITEIPLW